VASHDPVEPFEAAPQMTATQELGDPLQTIARLMGCGPDQAFISPLEGGKVPAPPEQRDPPFVKVRVPSVALDGLVQPGQGLLVVPELIVDPRQHALDLGLPAGDGAELLGEGREPISTSVNTG
jgi:hypothetical protein